MSVFIQLETDAFEENFRRQTRSTQVSDGGGRTSRAGRARARRPTRGIEIKEDTYATLKVIQADGSEIPLLDSSGADGFSDGGYTNFILQSVQDARMEKHQIVETFGDNYVFFFGENPRFLDITAILLNTHDFNWRAEWWANYDAYLRGSKLAELGARLYLFYDDIILEGYMIQCVAAETSEMPYSVQLQFKLFVTNYQNISFVGDPNFPIRSSVVLPDNIALTDPSAGGQLTSYFRGESFNAAASENADRQFQDASDAGLTGGGASANPLASGSRISKIIQSVPASFAISQNFWDFLWNTASFSEFQELRKLAIRDGSPIRGLIVDNKDEYVGGEDPRTNFGYDGGDLRPPSTVKGTIRSSLEVEDLFREAIQSLACFGADVDNPTAMSSLGLSASFGANGAGFGASASASAGSARASASAGTVGVSNGYQGSSQDPLASVFGAYSANLYRLSQDRSKYTEGAGDPLYGYPSDFAQGPGFGQAGFGDLGGLGYGSALGVTGDPGFKDPNKFTSAGVANNQSAFERFMRPKNDSTAITAGAGVSIGLDGVSAGAGVSVDGKPTAFALVSVPGVLDPSGSARQQASAIAAKQAQQKFGFSVDNPFGVNCPDPGGLGVSDGFNYTFP